jgi:tRNA (cytidine32/guanosine34-2'-O)-methyltransferase
MGMTSKDKRDIYYSLAKKCGYRARSAFKLKHIDEDFDIFKDAESVVDLCSAPGSWSQYAAEKLKGRESRIVSVDVQDLVPMDGVHCVKEDITSQECITKILDLLGDSRAELVLCDGAPDITGLHDLDEYMQAELLLAALAISSKAGRSGSSFVGKCFRGAHTPYLVAHFKKFYSSVRLLKPRSSRSSSMECFIYGTGMKETTCDPSRLCTDDAGCCGDVPLISCGHGPDPDITYEVTE